MEFLVKTFLWELSARPHWRFLLGDSILILSIKFNSPNLMGSEVSETLGELRLTTQFKTKFLLANIFLEILQCCMILHVTSFWEDWGGGGDMMGWEFVRLLSKFKSLNDNSEFSQFLAIKFHKASSFSTEVLNSRVGFVWRFRHALLSEAKLFCEVRRAKLLPVNNPSHFPFNTQKLRRRTFNVFMTNYETGKFQTSRRINSPES